MFKKIINYIKDFVDKCIFFYNNDEVYKKRTKNILFLFLGIDVVFLIVCYFINKLDVYNYIIFSLIVFAVWFVVQVLYSFFVVPSDYIQPNIDKLPNKIWNYPVVVQYNLPKWLNPSEVWMLYCKDYESTNVTCMVYKRENEWLIKMEDKWKWSYILHRNGEIGNNAPDYERRYWSIIFWYDRKQNVVWNDINPNFNYLYDLGYVHIELLKYCKQVKTNGGCKFIGPNNHYIVLPYSGYKRGLEKIAVGVNGFYLFRGYECDLLKLWGTGGYTLSNGWDNDKYSIRLVIKPNN